jgi:deoxyribonuclease-4
MTAGIEKIPPLLFGTGGIPLSIEKRSTINGIKRIHELGLGCMEIEFVQQVQMGEATARQVAETAGQADIKLSAHAPYYINLNSREPEKIKASQTRLLHTARIASLCGAVSVVFHAAFYMGDSPIVVYDTVKKYLKEVLVQLEKEKIRLWIRPEIMGKGSEFGTVDEVLRLSQEFDSVLPAIDFAHWHAREGKFNSYPEFVSVLEQVKEKLGSSALENIHLHVSGIKYGKKGELSHLNLKESDFRYTELLQALLDFDVRGLVVCESPNLEEDALLLKNTYTGLTRSTSKKLRH